MKKLILSEIHEKLGAKMVEFAGYYMPIQYDGVIIEHNTVRNSVGVFDVSHMGEVFVSGEEAENYLQYMTSNDVSKLENGQVQYTCFPNLSGGIVDDLLLYKISQNNFLLVINASNIKKDLQWLNKHNNFKCTISNCSDEYSLFALQGPKSIDLLQNLTNILLSNIKYYNFVIGRIGDIEDVIISRTGYTGELGFELYVKNNKAKELWNLLFSTNIKLKPIGLAARDTLRLEKAFCLYGNDINDSTSPIEAGLSWITKFNKEFINRDFFENQLKDGVSKKLVGIELIEKGIARQSYIIVNNEDEAIGEITSGTMSPTLNKSIALGYINSEDSNLNNEIFIKIRNKKVKAKVTQTPFVK